MPNSDSPVAADDRLRKVTLDFRQRARAEALLMEATDDTLTATFEIIFLRDRVKELESALQSVKQNIETSLRAIL